MNRSADSAAGAPPERARQEPSHDGEQIALWVVRHLGLLPAKTRNPLPDFCLAVVVFAAIQHLTSMYGLVRGALGPLLVFFLVAIGFERIRWGRKGVPPEDSVALPEPPLHARLVARGNRHDLAPLASLRDVPFEPMIFERIYVARSVWWIFGIGLPLGVAGQIWLEKELQVVPRGTLGGIPQVAGIIVVWLMARLHPTYYRIVPGRLDIMWFAPLANRGGVRTRLDLRKAKITANFARRVIELDAGGVIEVIPLFGISEPYRFVEAVFQAAISTFPAPPLPDDALLG